VPYQHILTVYDGTEQSEEVLDMVCRIAHPHRSRLTILVLKIVPLAEELPTYVKGSDPEVDALAAHAEQLAEHRRIHAATSVRYARAAGPALVSESRLHGIDLMALSVPDLDQLTSEQAWHDEVRQVLRRVTCAVMLCRPARQA
jgi:nucleotide-binding universal stress UspA family protein